MVSPLLARPRVVSPVEAGPGGDGFRGTCTVAVSPDEPVFAGHYPGFPILPGVCVVQCVHEAAAMLPPAGAGRLDLAAITSTRFVGAVFPGDDITVDLAWKRGDGFWACTAKAYTDRGEAAHVRLCYTDGGAA
ncbi:hypothetical protein [Micromonospora sp. NPDC005220]|uniref:3-hydroxyacyl-ACP dehydratase FabZ family protein n=1 Tax=Micromonospora sp. NPDC005220 TaxID=3155589 RepID=UPI00339F88F5